MPAFVYLLSCADGTLYTGYTVDLSRRVRQHERGQGSRYTRSRRPLKLVYWERLRSRKRAMQREQEIKRYTRARKLALVNSKNGS